jgi:hypothetical protein
MSFFSQFFEVYEETGEKAILCPFEHKTISGLSYLENNPSAHINFEKQVFHCKTCKEGLNEIQFMQRVLGCSYLDARKLQRCFQGNEDIHDWRKDTALTLTDESVELAQKFKITKRVLEELDVRAMPNKEIGLAFPVFMYDQYCDVRKYSQTATVKVRSLKGAVSGLIIPFDIWRLTKLEETTLICAGEKDMAVARSFGFNAITITGSEGTLPKAINAFKDRQVVICYDNDYAGITGAKNLGIQLLKVTEKVKICTKFHDICKENNEDITDFFNKYNKTEQDLIECIEQTELFVPKPEDLIHKYPVVDLLTASKPSNINKILQSNIQIVAVSDQTFIAPSAIEFHKFAHADKSDTLSVGTKWLWELEKDNVQDILHIIDNNFTERQIKQNLLSLNKVNPKERCIKQTTLVKTTVFKAYITDLFETSNADAKPMEYTVYALDLKLTSGEKYLATYKLVPHPYRGQQLIMILLNAEKANDSVSNFKITPTAKTNLDVFRKLEGTVKEKINHIISKAKGLIGYDGNDTLIKAIDLNFHTPLQFSFGSFKNMRGYLDTIVISESRLGKSSTAEAFRRTYQLGSLVSLAGNSATIAGLVGGSNKVGSSYQTRAGVIPQNHRGMLIFEEFGKSSTNITSELTDIRSSNEVRISRVSGSVTLPAYVRMLALTNVKSNGTIKSIASYPHGIEIIKELVQTAEDIARYDLIVILSDKGRSEIDPLWEPEQPFNQEEYQTRIRWIWSRTSDQIILTKEICQYIMKKANELNKKYECHIKIFGTEAWKKIARLSVAIAGYVVSTDDFETIKVTEEHIDYACELFKELYDNKTFKLKEYVEHERKFTVIDDKAVLNLQDIYNAVPSLILQLEQTTECNKNMLSAATGLENTDLNKALNRLTKGLFIKFTSHGIIPTERFRLALAKIDKETHVRRLGE